MSKILIVFVEMDYERHVAISVSTVDAAVLKFIFIFEPAVKGLMYSIF